MTLMSQEILDAVRDRLVNTFRPDRIIVFGSQARRDADSRSDLDLLVICRLEGGRRQLQIQMDRSLKGLGLARDIVILTPEEFERDRQIPGTIARPAWKEGIVLYEQPE